MTGSIAAARRASGLSASAHARITQMFQERGHAFDADRSGRRPVYKRGAMESAVKELIENKGQSFNGEDLRARLIEKGLLHANSDRKAFMSHLKKHLKSEGFRLTTNSTRTVFYLAPGDAEARLAFAHKMLSKFEGGLRLEDIIFIDETAHEKEPHPKGVFRVVNAAPHRGLTVRDAEYWPLRQVLDFPVPVGKDLYAWRQCRA